MKLKPILFLVLAIMTTTVVYAQKKAKKSPAEKQQARATALVDELGSKLSLSKDQKDKIYQLHLTHAQENAAIRKQVKSQEMDKESAKTRRKANNKTLNQGLKATLSEKQFEEYKKWKQEKKAEKKAKKQEKKKEQN